MKCWLFLFIYSGLCWAQSSIEVTLFDGTSLDCSQSTSIPAACVSPDGSRYLVQANESFAHAISLSPSGDINTFVGLKEVKSQGQVIFASIPFPGMGGYGPGFPGSGSGPMPAPRSTHRSDLMNYISAVGSLKYMDHGMSDLEALKLLQEMRELSQTRLEIAEKNVNPPKIEIEMEGDKKSTCEKVKANGDLTCPIYRCADPQNSFYIDNQFGQATLMILNDSNQIQKNESVNLVWNTENRDKPIMEYFQYTPVMGGGMMAGLGSYAAPSEESINTQRIRQLQISRQRPTIQTQQPQLLSHFSNPEYRSVISGMTSSCDPNEVASLVSGINSMRQSIADAEMVQIVEVTNNILTSRLINPEAIPENSCRDGDTWYRDDSFVFSRELLAQNTPMTIDLATARRLFNEARAMDDIAWDYKADGCYARAHLMARRFEEQGIEVDKVWIKGDLKVPEAEVNWNFHVAPIVYVEDANGNVQKMVIDPSLMDGPVSVDQWSEKMQKGVIGETIETQYPFPENVLRLERTAIAFSNSDPYLPYDQITMSEEEKMTQSNETMVRYLGFTEPVGFSP